MKVLSNKKYEELKGKIAGLKFEKDITEARNKKYEKESLKNATEREELISIITYLLRRYKNQSVKIPTYYLEDVKHYGCNCECIEITSLTDNTIIIKSKLPKKVISDDNNMK